jgi:hypothetical protein
MTEKYFYKDIQSVINDYLMPSKDEIKKNYKECMNDIYIIFHGNSRARGHLIRLNIDEDEYDFFSDRGFNDVFREIRACNFFSK